MDSLNYYQSCIDPTDFRTVAAYLRNPASPIEYVLHVPSREQLAPLAEELSRAMEREAHPQTALRELVQRHLADGTARISSRQALPGQDPQHCVDAASIPGTAACDVIHLPPFYLAHTPGLFEGRLQVQRRAITY